MNIAVTGASGFVGRHVVTELVGRAQTVTPILRPSLQTPTEPGHPGVVYMDVREPPPNAYEVMGRPDALIHLAWGGLANYQLLRHFEEELPAHYAFLKGLVADGLKKLVVAGTCLEYGMQSGPLREDVQCEPVNPYGMAKDALRRQLQFLRLSRPFALTWARLFYLFGEGQAEASLFPQLKRAIERGDGVFRMSRGEQLRDYLPVTEVAKLLVSLTLDGHDDGVVNVCSGVPVSVRTLVEGWANERGWPVKLVLGHYPYPDYEPMAFWGVREKLDGCLALKPSELSR
jgi:nucleoside-diphosphate-sugar epimerase